VCPAMEANGGNPLHKCTNDSNITQQELIGSSTPLLPA
jgi:hypothetical protein